MTSALTKMLRKLLLAWGVVSLVAVIALAVYVAYEFSLGNTSKIDTATEQDVRFVLNWSGLGEARIEKVLHSYVSARSLTGDHLDAYAIRISHVDVAELLEARNAASPTWYRGDQLPVQVNDALAFAGSWLGGDEVPWFPSEAELRSAAVYVYPSSIYTHGIQPTAVKLIFVRPADNMIFYFSGKT